MKKIITLIVLIVMSFSCSDAQKSKTDQTKNDSYLTAKIDGVNFLIDAPYYYSAQNIITLAAVSKDGNEKIRIYINYNNGPTTYTFGKGISNSDNMAYTNNKTHWLAAKTKGNGTITFTEKGNYLMGEFSFTGVNKENNSTKQITEGKFRVLKK